jgi:ABC-type multidrug transport system ATPase subunit
LRAVPDSADRSTAVDEVETSRPLSVDVAGVSHSFHGRTALADVSLSVSAGEIHALIGPNGAGKTTLLRVLAGLLHPQNGRAFVSGVDATTEPMKVRRRMGLMPTGERTLYYRISGFENLVFFARLQGMRRRDAARRARELLAEVGLADAADLLVGGYSNGMKKRLSFARAVLVDPPVLLIDEATHDLDVQGGRIVRDLTKRAARRGSAVLWATQRLDEVRGFADRVTLLANGKVRFQGSVDDFVADVPRRYVLEVRNGTMPASALLPSLRQALEPMLSAEVSGPVNEGRYVLSLGDGSALGEAIAAFAAAELYVTSCREERAPMEEAFVRMTTAEES